MIFFADLQFAMITEGMFFDGVVEVIRFVFELKGLMANRAVIHSFFESLAAFSVF
jgi:hypothetical protein